MISEKVEITLGDSAAQVTCRFDLKNEGQAQKLLTGFPAGAGPYPVRNLRAWVNRQEVRVTHHESIPTDRRSSYQALKTFTVPFASGETVTVTIRYQAPMLPEGRAGHFALEDLGFIYILETGAYWKGAIGEAVITVDFGSIPVGRISRMEPKGYSRKGNAFVWRFKDLEPVDRDNIRISLIQKNIYKQMLLLTEHPSASRVHYILGTLYFNRWTSPEISDSHREKAEREFRKALQLDPGILDARYYLAWSHLLHTERGKRPYGAIEQLREIIRRDPNYTCRDDTFPVSALRGSGIPDTRASTLLTACEKGSWTIR